MISILEQFRLNCHSFILFCQQIVQLLNPQDGQLFIDMTFGEGGHTRALLNTGRDIRIIAVDRDPAAYELAVEMAEKTKGKVIPMLAKFSEVPGLLKKHDLNDNCVSGIIIDCGPSKLQLNDASRGFSINKIGPLDMRMDGPNNPDSITANDVIDTLDTEDLTRLFKTYGQDKLARKYAQALVDARFMLRKFHSTVELANFIDSIAAERLINEVHRTRTSSTRIFQALRIFVNNELNELNYAIQKMRPFLFLDPETIKLCAEKDNLSKASEEEMKNSFSGKLATISYNPLEDTIIKQKFQSIEMDHPLTEFFEARLKSHLHQPTETDMKRVSTKKWFSFTKMEPLEEDIILNPHLMSARLRVVARIR